MARLPFRLNNESRYFNDPYEALPKHGYTRFFENILLQDKNIDVRLNVDYFKVLSMSQNILDDNFFVFLTLQILSLAHFLSLKVQDVLPAHKLLIFTGPIDAFYASQGMEKLEYRSIYFEVRIYFLKPAEHGFLRFKF